ncbi:hypothetical protein ACFY2R_23875 [Micromonospora olivasterospora]|uniref:hypothetical protein n=1 Tax=Micromonospora olivasterospora TaxID=1880 RepID=UPI0011A398C7|nr:hypothetical protein [Micromonospora olivasterospora]
MIAAALAFGLSACRDNQAPAAAPRTGNTIGGANVSVAGYPGLYYDASLVSAVPAADDHLRLVGAMTCPQMDAMLSAGQWRVADRLSLPPGSAGAAIAGIVPGLLLERAGTLAFVALKGDRALCTGTVMKAGIDGIALTGKGLPGPTTGWSATTMCIRLGDDTLNVSLYFDTRAKIGGLATVTLVGKNEKYTVDGSGSDFNILMLNHKSTVLDAFGKAFSGQEKPAGVTMRSLEPGDAFSGTATVDATAADRPHGTFSITGLVDDATEATVGLSLPFACADVQVIKAG